MARSSSVFHQALRPLLDLARPGRIRLLLQQRQQRAQRRGAVANHVDFHRIAQAEPAAVDIDLDAARGARLGKKLAVGKRRADHQEGVATLHQIPARLGPEQSERAGDEGQIVRHRGLAEQRLGDAGLAAAPRPRSPRRWHRARPPRPAWRLSCRCSERRRPREDWPRPAVSPVPHSRCRCASRHGRPADPRRSSSCRSFGKMTQVTARLCMRDAHGAVDQMAHLLGHAGHPDELAGNVLETGSAGRLPADSKRRAPVRACWPTSATTGTWSILAS